MLSTIIPSLFSAQPIVALIVYVVTFVIIAIAFSAIDFSKILRKEYRTLTLGSLLLIT